MESKDSDYYNKIQQVPEQVDPTKKNLSKLEEVMNREQHLKKTVASNVEYENQHIKESLEDVSERPVSPSIQDEPELLLSLVACKEQGSENELPSFEEEMKSVLNFPEIDEEQQFDMTDGFESWPKTRIDEDEVAFTDEDDLEFDDDLEEESIFFESDDSIQLSLEGIREQLNTLQHTVNTKIADIQFQENTIQQLRTELQSYKAAEKQEYAMPLVRQLIHLIDKYKLELEIAQQQVDQNIIRFFVDVIQDLHDTLFNYGVQALKPLEKFDAKRHNVSSVVETDKIELDRVVNKVKGYAYEWNGRLIRPENVVIYKYNQLVNGGANE